MRALVVYCHPNPTSFTAAVRDVIVSRLEDGGAEVRMLDLYARAFDPILSLDDLEKYEDTSRNTDQFDDDVAAIAWCDALIFVYPTWWYGLPGVLKGWLDRVLVPGVAFHMPDGGDIKPGLTHISHLGVFTTCGASFWLSAYVGFPGRRTIIRGIGLLCARGCRTRYIAHYLMDASTAETRARHLTSVSRSVDRFMGPKPWWQIW